MSRWWGHPLLLRPLSQGKGPHIAPFSLDYPSLTPIPPCLPLVCPPAPQVYHMGCYVPPLPGEPADDWVCLLCSSIDEILSVRSTSLPSSSLSSSSLPSSPLTAPCPPSPLQPIALHPPVSPPSFLSSSSSSPSLLLAAADKSEEEPRQPVGEGPQAVPPPLARDVPALARVRAVQVGTEIVSPPRMIQQSAKETSS